MADQSEPDTRCEWCEHDPGTSGVPCSKASDVELREQYFGDANETCRKAIEIRRPDLFEDNP